MYQESLLQYTQFTMSSPLQSLSTTRLFDLKIVSTSFDQVVEALTQASQLTLVATPNPEQIVLADRNSHFKTNLQEMDVLLPDGTGLVLASHVLAAADKAKSISERITGVDVVTQLVADAHSKNQAVLVIGGRGYEKSGEVVEKVGSQKITEKRSDSQAASFDLYQLDLENVGSVYWLEAYQNAAQPTEVEEALIEKVFQAVKPRYVFVAFGAPAQENWLVTHKQQLAKHHVRVAMAVGGSFDILTGILSRAPSLFLKLNLEWLYRLIQEPWRWKRQLQLVTFIKLVIQSVLE